MWQWRSHQQIFVGSILNVPLFELPFSRDVSLDRTKLRLMRMQLERCRLSGGFLCVSKEHRQSLMLKQQARPPLLRSEAYLLLF